MSATTYAVRAAADITRRGPGHTRRRAGLVFGESETLISTEPGTGGLSVTPEQLRAILQDSNLRQDDAGDSSTPGLRVKLVAERAAAVAGAEPETGAAAGEEPVPLRRSPGRPRKAAQE